MQEAGAVFVVRHPRPIQRWGPGRGIEILVHFGALRKLLKWRREIDPCWLSNGFGSTWMDRWGEWG